MRSTHGSAWRRTALWSIVAVVLWMGMTTPALADMRIVMEGEGGSVEYFMKNGRLSMPQTDGSRYVIECDSGVFTLIMPPSESVFWRGTVAEFVGEIEAAMDAMMAAIADEVSQSMHDAFADFFGGGGGGREGPVSVRTTRMGTDTVGGYDAVYYKVEYEQDGTWHTFEDVWVAPALLTEVEAEVGQCMSTMGQDVMQTMTGLFAVDLGMDTMASVAASPEYLALHEEGYPVRNQSVMQVFGMRFETTTEVVQVSLEPLSDDLFTVPAGYEQIHELIDLSDF